MDFEILEGPTQPEGDSMDVEMRAQDDDYDYVDLQPGDEQWEGTRMEATFPRVFRSMEHRDISASGTAQADTETG